MTETANHSESDQSTDGSENQKPNDNPVSYETHRRLLDEKKKIQAKLAAFEAAQKAREEEDLAKKGEVQKLLDMAKKEAEELRLKVRSHEERDIQAKKLSSVIRGLGSNVDEKWFGVIGQHIDDVVYNTETGEIEQMSVSSVVDNLKKTWPEMLKKTQPGMPGDAPRGNGATSISREEWLKLSAKDMKKWRPEQIL